MEANGPDTPTRLLPLLYGGSVQGGSSAPWDSGRAGPAEWLGEGGGKGHDLPA